MPPDKESQIEYQFKAGFDKSSEQYFYACEYRRAGQERWYVIAVFHADLATAMNAVHRSFYWLLVNDNKAKTPA